MDAFCGGVGQVRLQVYHPLWQRPCAWMGQVRRGEVGAGGRQGAVCV
jgi:hypothetical protein